jgi:hypothetical protein
MDEVDRLLAELERVQARLGWLPPGARGPRERLARVAARLQQDLALALVAAAPSHLVPNE